MYEAEDYYLLARDTRTRISFSLSGLTIYLRGFISDNFNYTAKTLEIFLHFVYPNIIVIRIRKRTAQFLIDAQLIQSNDNFDC